MNTETNELIKEFCEAFDIINYTINPDMSVDVDGDVNISYVGIGEFPFEFNRVTGNFNCSYNCFSSIYKGPKYVGGIFDVSYNMLCTFQYFPVEIGGTVLAYNNEFESLEQMPVFDYLIEAESEIMEFQRIRTIYNIITS